MEWFNSLNWSQILMSSGITGIIVVLVQHITNRKLEKYKFSINKILEEHKTYLQEVIETMRFENQRKILEFNLSTSKKHEFYIRIHEVIVNIELEFESFKREYYIRKPCERNNDKVIEKLKTHLFWDSLENNLKIVQIQALIYIPKKLYDEINEYRNNMMILSQHPENNDAQSKVQHSLYMIREIIKDELKCQ